MKIEEIGNILGANTIEKVYEDGLSSATKETSKALRDVVKSFRLFTLPFQLAATLQDRLDKYFEKVRSEVPEERQIDSPSMISGPIIERLKYLDENNHLTELFLSLLARSIDKERINEAHPAFIYLIDQLSPDEAVILLELKDKEIKVVDRMDYDRTTNLFSNLKIIDGGFPIEKLVFPDKFSMYYNHLESLNLITWPVDEQKGIIENNIQTGLTRYSTITPTEFGNLFIKACIPENGFVVIKKESIN